MLNTTSEFAAAQTGEPINETGAGSPQATQPGQIHTIFNKKRRGLLNHLLAPENNIPDESWRTLSGFPTAGSVTDKTIFIAAYINRVFAAEWKEPVKPAELAANADNRTRIAHEREMAAYKKARRLHDAQYFPSLAYFTEQVLKAWPGYKETVSDSDFKEGLPKPILPEDYPRFAQSLLWYLTQARDPHGQRLAQTAHDLRTTSLQEIQSEWVKTFPSSVTSQHLQSCDDLFINCEIPENTPSDARHPDPAVKTHAEIIATGLTADGKNWTLRRINSQEAAMYYGNTERTADGTPQQNASPLCFTWSGERTNHFHQYRRGLMMIARDDGSIVRFMHFGTEDFAFGMYNDMQDKPIALEQIFQEFPKLADTVIPFMESLMSKHIENKNFLNAMLFLGVMKNIPECRPSANIIFTQKILSLWQTMIYENSFTNPDSALDAIRGVTEWEQASAELVSKELQERIKSENWHSFSFLLSICKSALPAWQEVAMPLALQHIGAALRSMANNDNALDYRFGLMLDQIKGVPAWERAAWEGCGQNASSRAQRIMTFVLGPMPDFDDPASASAEAPPILGIL